MILHRLIRHHARHGYDHAFSLMQVDDAVDWLLKRGVALGEGTSVLDLGCGSGTFGQRLRERGCRVTFADETDWLSPEIPKDLFRRFNIDAGEVAALGRYDLVVCSNVLEHLRQPEQLIRSLPSLLHSGGHLYLSWTNWLSPWGGHDFSPFHYLGPRLGPWVHDRVRRRPRLLKPFENLFVTHIGSTLSALRGLPDMAVLAVAPRYYTELWPLMKLPVLREFLAWNCVVLMRAAERQPGDGRG